MNHRQVRLFGALKVARSKVNIYPNVEKHAILLHSSVKHLAADKTHHAIHGSHVRPIHVAKSISRNINVCAVHIQLGRSCPTTTSSSTPNLKPVFNGIFSRSVCSLRNNHNNAFLLESVKKTASRDPRFGLSVRHQMSKAKSKEQQVVESKGSQGELTTGQKVKQASKDATYTGIVLIGVGITGIMFFAIGRELLSSQSPNGVYSSALKKCKNNDDVYVVFGSPLKGHGEMNRRGRARHVSHTKYLDGNDVEHMRMKFYIQGPEKKRGTVHLEVQKNERGKYEFRYLFVEVEDYPKRTIIIEDNR